MHQRRKLSEQARRDLMTRAASLTALTQHPGWPDFQATVDDKIERIERAVIAKALLSRDPLEPESILYWRGFVHGLRYLVAAPSGAQARLESFLREQAPQSEEAA